MYRFLTFFVALLVAAPLDAQATDSLATSRENRALFTRSDAVFAGAVATGALGIYLADEAIYDALQSSSLQNNNTLHDGVETLSNIHERSIVMLSGASYLVGRLTGADAVADVGLHSAEAVLLSWGLIGLLKNPAGRPRPKVREDANYWKWGRGYDDGGYRSFPSLHAGGAFAGAAVLAAELRRRDPAAARIITPLAYGTAGLVSIGRVYQSDHWASDSLVGAAIGTFVGLKVVQFHHSHPNNFFDRILLHTAVAPSPEGDGVRLMWRRAL